MTPPFVPGVCSGGNAAQDDVLAFYYQNGNGDGQNYGNYIEGYLWNVPAYRSVATLDGTSFRYFALNYPVGHISGYTPRSCTQSCDASGHCTPVSCTGGDPIYYTTEYWSGGATEAGGTTVGSF